MGVYAVVASATAASGDTMAAPYQFTFSVKDNPTPKRPTSAVVVPTGTLQAGQSYTINGQASGYVWQRDTDNPLELRHWNADGVDVGAGPMLHPTALYFPDGQDGYKYWLSYTPYPPESDENPVIVRSNDGETFTAAGVPHNPVFTSNLQPPYDSQNLADPELLKVGNTWMLFYEMETPSSTAASIGEWMHGGGYIGLALSTDGKTWLPYGGPYTYDPATPPTSPPTTGNPIIVPESTYAWEEDSSAKSGEPAVVFKDGIYHMWRTVIPGDNVAYDTASDPRGPWTKHSAQSVSGGGYGRTPTSSTTQNVPSGG